jgi:glycosyltransferase involved in cell wall biosynthesis
LARIRRWTIWAIQLPFAVAWLAAVAFAARRDTIDRRRRGDRPRLVYGPIPIISIKYMSEAMRRVGYDTLTLVHEVYSINARSDFDQTSDTLFHRSRRPRVTGDFGAFAWLLRRYDVFHFFYDGGFLRRTPLRRLEVQLLHLAGKKVIVMPYGSDVALVNEIQSVPWRDGLVADYPTIGQGEDRRRRWIRYFTNHADYIVAGLVHFETLPRWDLLTIHYYPVDTTEWTPASGSSLHDGRSGPVVVLHAPNHRAVKGTDALLQACDELRAEGLQVTLRLLEGVPNTRVREEMRRADVIAEQFILGYALTAIEGMSLGKPVISNLTDDRYYARFREHTRFGQCPIVSSTTEDLKDSIRRLVVDPSFRAEAGAAGREYVLREHSYPAMARLWERIYQRVWHGDSVDPADLLRP